MTSPARRVRLRGFGEYRDEAEALLELPGDIAAVVRVRPRSLVVRCPDGCGDTLVVNLDARAGKAWRMDSRGGTVTLYPSVWRDDGCGSHFIVWRNHVVWCDRFEEGNDEPPHDPALDVLVLAELDPSAWKGAEGIAEALGELAWDVARALRRLVRAGDAVAGSGANLGFHRRR